MICKFPFADNVFVETDLASAMSLYVAMRQIIPGLKFARDFGGKARVIIFPDGHYFWMYSDKAPTTTPRMVLHKTFTVKEEFENFHRALKNKDNDVEDIEDLSSLCGYEYLAFKYLCEGEEIEACFEPSHEWDVIPI